MAIDAKATERLLVEYGVNSDDNFGEEYQNFPSSNITNSVVSQSIRSSDELCSNSRYKPRIESYAQGSFTSPNTREELYLIYIGDSCGSRAIGTIRIVIARGTQVTTYGEVSANHSLKKITDINNDGINEILLEGSWLGQGAYFMWNRFLEIRPRGILTLAQFNTYANNRGDLGTTDSVTNIRYKVFTEKISKVYYELGDNNRLSKLRGDWMIRYCLNRELNSPYQCIPFEPFFSYRIPLSASDDGNFRRESSLYFESWFHRVCHNICEIFEPPNRY